MSKTPSNKPSYIISVDIEADGETPIVSSCLEVGIVVADVSTDSIVSHFSCMMKPAPGHHYSERCKREFWDKHKEHWDEIHTQGVTPEEGMRKLADWWKNIKESANRCTWIARPASYDWTWLSSWYEAFGPTDKIPLPHSISCISTLRNQLIAMNMLSAKDLQDKFNLIPSQITHYAVADATHQLYMYWIICEEFKKIRNSCEILKDRITNC